MMEAPTYWTAYLVAGLATMALILLSNRLRRPKLNLPPGPKPWPIIGNFNLIGPLPHRSLHELSKKYGSIMMLRFGSVPVLVGSSVEMARLFLKTHDVVFAGRPRIAAGKHTTYDYSDITWSQYGPYFRQARKICSMELFSPTRIESYRYIRVEELNSFLRCMFQLSLGGEPIVLKDYISTLSLNVISRMVLGKRYLDEGESSVWTLTEFKMMLDELFLLNGVLNLGDWIPWLKHFDVQGYVKRMKALAKKFDVFLEHVLDEHNFRRTNEKESWVAKDMVDVLLQLADDPNLEVKLERKGVKAFTQDLLAGGTDSSTITVEWAMSELLRHPEIIVKATEELDQVIGRERWVLEEDIQNLPYIRSIIKETMRLHPVAPMLVPRMSSEDVQIQGYHVPRGSLVLVNTFTMQRDPYIYENPENFWPDRFLGKDIDIKGQHFELLPFGSGRRMCPGYNLGLKIIESSLANLLHGFTWRLPNNMMPKHVNMEELFGLTNSKKIPLVVCVEPRLASHHVYHSI